MLRKRVQICWPQEWTDWESTLPCVSTNPQRFESRTLCAPVWFLSIAFDEVLIDSAWHTDKHAKETTRSQTCSVMDYFDHAMRSPCLLNLLRACSIASPKDDWKTGTGTLSSQSLSSLASPLDTWTISVFFVVFGQASAGGFARPALNICVKKKNNPTVNAVPKQNRNGAVKNENLTACSSPRQTTSSGTSDRHPNCQHFQVIRGWIRLHWSL